jgi:hypothetical protein
LSCPSVAVQTKQVKKHIGAHKGNNTKTTVPTIQNKVNKVNILTKLTHITKPTHAHITKQVKTTTAQVTTTVQDKRK